jgi:hypothetical protein
MLVDTGSQISLLRGNVADIKLSPTRVTVKGATGHALGLRGTGRVELEFQKGVVSADIYVATSNLIDNILGMDILSKLGAIVDLNR